MLVKLLPREAQGLVSFVCIDSCNGGRHVGVEKFSNRIDVDAQNRR